MALKILIDILTGYMSLIVTPGVDPLGPHLELKYENIEFILPIGVVCLAENNGYLFYIEDYED